MKHAKTIVKIKKFYFLLCWSFFVFYITTFPFEQDLELGTGQVDKIFHLILFFGFNYFLYNFLIEFSKNKYLIATISIIISLTYIVTIEYLQIFIPGRFYSLYDILFGLIGAFLSLFFLFNKK